MSERDETWEPSADEDFRMLPVPAPRAVEVVGELAEREWSDDDFEFEGAEVAVVEGVWLYALTAFAEADPDDPIALWHAAWAAEVGAGLAQVWGPPEIYPLSLNDEGAPEALLDLILGSQGLTSAEVWRRGDRAVVLQTGWRDGGTDSFSQTVLVMPWETYSGGGLAEALVSQGATEADYVMFGEQTSEVLRRVHVLSSLLDDGPVSLPETPGDATRYSYRVQGGAADWYLADDGRVLLLLWGDEALPSPGELGTDDLSEVGGELTVGVPAELLALAQHGGVTAGSVDGRPIVSAALWWDGEHWHAAPGTIMLASRHGLGIDDLGFNETVRRPLRLGAALTVDHVVDQLAPDPETRQEYAAGVEAALASAPFEPGARPSAAASLGYAFLTDHAVTSILDDLEQATAAWWGEDLPDGRFDDETFVVGGRLLEPGGGLGRSLFAVLGTGDPWQFSAVQEWAAELYDAAWARWGTPNTHRFTDPQDAEWGVRRTGLTLMLRAGEMAAVDYWWVNGLAVGLSAERLNPGDPPRVMVTVCPADSLLEVGEGSLEERRHNVRMVAAVAGRSEDRSWAGPALGDEARRLDLPAAMHAATQRPDARRFEIPLTSGEFLSWTFTYDRRALLVTYRPDSPLSATNRPEAERYAAQRAVFDGVPDDLRSLAMAVGEGPSVEADGESPLPAATAVWWTDGGTYWETTPAVLRAVRDLPGDETPDAVLAATGVDPASEVVRTGDQAPFDLLDRASEPWFDEVVLPDGVEVEDIHEAIERCPTAVDAAMSGDLNDLIDLWEVAEHPMYLLDAVVSNPDPARRLELTFWLLRAGLHSVGVRSRTSPVTLLLDNAELDPVTDGIVIAALMARGAGRGLNHYTPRIRGGGHPVIQLCDLDRDEGELEPLYAAIFSGTDFDPDEPELPGDPMLLDHLYAGEFGHEHGRARLQQWLVAYTAAYDAGFPDGPLTGLD